MEAEKWYRKAAEQGDVQAQSKLEEMKNKNLDKFNPATWNPPAQAGRGMSHNSREVALL